MTKVLISSDSDEMYRRSADAVVKAGIESISRSGRFTLVLSGGSTPGGLYSLLAAAPYRRQLSWNRVHLFWGDERCVPPDHPDSNFRFAESSLITPLGLSEHNLHRIRGELPTAEESAAEYERELGRFFRLRPGAFPSFDLILLGLGSDGHTASLFPFEGSVHEQDRVVVATESAHAGTRRVSLSLPAINHAQRVFYLISGATKAGAVREVIEGSEKSEPPPAALVRPFKGELQFFLDEAAASKLVRRPRS